MSDKCLPSVNGNDCIGYLYIYIQQIDNAIALL